MPLVKNSRKPVGQEYLRMYWSDWLRAVRGLKPVNKANCYGCNKSGLLGSELRHVGPTRHENLFCETCRKTGDKNATDKKLKKNGPGKAPRSSSVRRRS